MTQSDKDILHNFLLDFNIVTDFRVVERYESMNFIIHSNEDCGHNKAHVHVQLSNKEEIEISIDDGKILNVSEKFPRNKIKKAEEFVRNHKGLFINNWNEFSNGVHVNI